MESDQNIELQQVLLCSLVFLGFSASGVEVQIDDNAVPATTPAPVSNSLSTYPPPSVLILGWAGSDIEALGDVSAYYQSNMPHGCRVVRSVGGSDQWNIHPANDKIVPAEVQAAYREQLDRIVEAISYGSGDGGGAEAAAVPVLVHCFSNNGWLLYVRLLQHLASIRASTGGSDTRQKGLADRIKICGVVMDSAPGVC
jgi:hypothetical protein